MRVDWVGVMPAITTPFLEDGLVDHGRLAAHCRRLADAACTGLVALGSLGEGGSLAPAEKAAVLRTAVGAVDGRIPVVAGVAGLSTAECVRLAGTAAGAGCSGLMVLPPYVYSTDWREMRAHVTAVLASTSLPAMLYNNPAAYRTDFLPEQIAELAALQGNLAAVKESSGDARRITAIRALTGDRLRLLVGLDDCVVEGVLAGATGWIAGLVNAFPEESVALLRLAEGVRDGRGGRTAMDALYAWFLPLLRMDGAPKFVQLIKLAQELAGAGAARVRPPRLPLVGRELEDARVLITAALDSRPAAGV